MLFNSLNLLKLINFNIKNNNRLKNKIRYHKKGGVSFKSVYLDTTLLLSKKYNKKIKP